MNWFVPKASLKAGLPDSEIMRQVKAEVAEADAEAQREEDRYLKLEARADEAFLKLPVAGTTEQCPKCRFKPLTYRYDTAEFWRSQWRRPFRTTLYTRSGPTRKVLFRGCPQCSAEVIERPADTEPES